MTETDGTTFLSGANAEFIAGLYSRFLDDPASVDEGWRRFFDELGDDATALNAERAGPAWGHPPRPARGERGLSDRGRTRFGRLSAGSDRIRSAPSI